jgi:DNA-binding response OmpR family regulator
MLYSEKFQSAAEKRCCPRCGQPLPKTEKYGIRMTATGIRYRDEDARLSPYHMRIFATLLQCSPEPATRERLYQVLYSDETDSEKPQTRPLDALMHYLRKRLEPTGLKIETIYALGWRLVPPVSVLDI